MSKRLIRVYCAVAAILAVTALVSSSIAGVGHPPAKPNGSEQSDPDQIFVALRNAAHDNDADRALQLAAQIPDYPVPSYLEYFQLKPQLFDPLGHARIDAPDSPVLKFLTRYDGQAIADRLRNDYLLVLGARRDWQHFDEQYHRFALDDDTNVKCYALESRLSQGGSVVNEAQMLLTDPRQYDDGCIDLINLMAQRRQLTSDEVWQQIRQAYEANYITLGGKLADALGQQRPNDGLFRMAAIQPSQLLSQLARAKPGDDVSRQLALLAVTSMARSNPAQAAATFATITSLLTPLQQSIGWGTIAYQAALQRLPAATDWYRLSARAPLSYPAYEWRVRAALLSGDWAMVRWAVEQMPTPLRAQPSWIYWHARALQETGNTDQARREFESIAANFDFYGQLATEALGRKITLPPRTVVSDAEIDPMRAVSGFQLAQKFYAINLRFEGNREWNWALRGMTDQQLLAAAKFAQHIKLYDRVVNTADRTQAAHDFSLRFLAPFRDSINRSAKNTGLDIEWTYGLIRQESRFIISAHSGAGAAGLMQLMPATARHIAKKVGINTLSHQQIADIDTNILLGTRYLAMIYHQFGASAVLASAGYNAGPRRAQQWRQTLPRRVEGAIFVEAIPFNETRDYVKKVLSNTVYYAALFEARPQSLKVRLGYIAP